MHRPIELVVPQRVIERFKREAKELFPKECYGYTLGHDFGNRVEVRDLWLPAREDMLKHVTDYEVDPPRKWAVAALEDAEERDMVVLGDIHSHPWKYSEYAKGAYKPDHAPSEADLLSSGGVVHAICLVLQTKTGRLRSSIGWYGPIIPVVVKNL